MYINLTPEDKSVSVFEAQKNHEYSNANGVDSATLLNVVSLEAKKGVPLDTHTFNTSSAEYNSIVIDGKENKIFKVPLFYHISCSFVKYAHQGQPQNVIDDLYKYRSPWGRQGLVDKLCLHKIHDRANVISIPQNLFGEGVVSGSVRLTSYETTGTKTIVDDGNGNLYDKAFESQFKAGTPRSKNSGSAVGFVNYPKGLVIITDTGSYQYTGLDSGSYSVNNGWKIEFKSTKTIKQLEYYCTIGEGKLNSTTNISTTFQRSGSITYPSASRVSDLREFLPGAAESQYELNGRDGTDKLEGFATHSEFAPYMTTIGLYNDNKELLAVSKLSRAIKKDPDLGYTFIVKFDI